MNNHYIPRLILKQFAIDGTVSSFDYKTFTISTKKIKKTFSTDNLYGEELEKTFANKLEGPIGNLLNHKLLKGDSITLKRSENFLLRKFILINTLRSPVINCTYDEMIRDRKLENHPYTIQNQQIMESSPEVKRKVYDNIFSKANYISNLEKAMEIESIEDIAKAATGSGVSEFLKLCASYTLVSVAGFWDSSDTGLEFILPKLNGASVMDYGGPLFKADVLRHKSFELIMKYGSNLTLMDELHRLIDGSIIFPENYSIHPISPTRALVLFSPYFRAFFPQKDSRTQRTVFPPFLDKAQFDEHFFEPTRLELFTPCSNTNNQIYKYTVKKLNTEEVNRINSMLLEMETEEFVYHDYSKIRDSFRYYDKEMKFALPKKYDFSHME